MCHTNETEATTKGLFALTSDLPQQQRSSMMHPAAILAYDNKDAATLRYLPTNLVQYSRRHGCCPVRITCVRAVCYRFELCWLENSHQYFTDGK